MDLEIAMGVSRKIYPVLNRVMMGLPPGMAHRNLQHTPSHSNFKKKKKKGAPCAFENIFTACEWQFLALRFLSHPNLAPKSKSQKPQEKLIMDLDDPLDFENEDPLLTNPVVNKKRYLFSISSFTFYFSF